METFSDTNNCKRKPMLTIPVRYTRNHLPWRAPTAPKQFVPPSIILASHSTWPAKFRFEPIPAFVRGQSCGGIHWLVQVSFTSCNRQFFCASTLILLSKHKSSLQGYTWMHLAQCLDLEHIYYLNVSRLQFLMFTWKSLEMFTGVHSAMDMFLKLQYIPLLSVCVPSIMPRDKLRKI